MKRTIILLGILGFIAIVYFSQSKSEDPVLTKLNAERNFAVDAKEKVYKIVITERNKKSIVLKKEQDIWYVNEKYKARQNAMDNLLDVIENVGIQFIPSASANQNIIREMSTIGVQVDLFDEKDIKLKSYTVGGSTPDERGTYMLMENSSQPFVVDINSIEGSIRGRFIMKEEDWRDRSVLDENINDISAIHIEYSSMPQESFDIFLNAGEVSKMESNGRLINYSSSKVKAYVLHFESVYAEYIDNANPLRDSISLLKPFCTIRIDYPDNNKSLALHPLDNLMYESNIGQQGDVLKVEGRYFVDCSWGDFMLVQHRLIGKLLRGKTYFEQ